jgi:hypothetical protein
MSTQQFHTEVMAQRESLEARFDAGEFNERFADWVCENYAPIWDDRLCDLMQDGDVINKFLESMV